MLDGSELDKIVFDRRWRLEWEREKLHIHPRYYKDLPVLPAVLQPINVTPLLQELKKLKTSMSNRAWMSLCWLSPSYRTQHKRVQALEEIVNLPFVEIPAGSFMMGALPNDGHAQDSEKPRHKVTLTQGVWMSKYPCTQELYEKVMGKNPSYYKGNDRPVERVSWCDAVLFCHRLSALEGLEPCYELPEPFRNDDDWSKKVRWNKSANGYRLPTEAEWEYCARGGEEHLYSGSDNIDEVAWYDDNSHDETHPVGQKKANGYGLHDMSGNVEEWVWDAVVVDRYLIWKGESLYTKSAKTDPSIDRSSLYRIIRGGCWHFPAGRARVFGRYMNNASFRYSHLGFRFLRTIT